MTDLRNNNSIFELDEATALMHADESMNESISEFGGEGILI